MLSLFLSIFLCYFLGSIPTAFIAGKLIKGVDIREFGSGNVGATNVYRVVGKVPGILVLLIDITKGLLAVTLLANFFYAKIFSASQSIPLIPAISLTPDLFKIILGMVTIAGHNWTIFLKFRGGKGVATSGGVLLGLAPKVVGICLLIWIVMVLLFRYVSLASITVSIALPILIIVFGGSKELILFSVILCIISTYKHRSNIKRLLKGQEKKIW